MRVGSVVVAAWLAGCVSVPELMLVSEPVVIFSDGVRLVADRCAKTGLLMPVEIDGTLGWFVVDTGAYVNVVFEEFAVRAKLVLEDNLDRVGGGYGVPVKKVVPRSFAIPGIPNVATPELVMLEESASPLARDTCGVAGVVSPLLLATADHAVVVDYESSRMSRIPNAAVETRLAAAGRNRFTATRTRNEWVPSVDAAFGPASLRLMIDTGACCTWVTESSGAGKHHIKQSTAGARIVRLSGVTSSRKARTSVRFGDVKRTLDIRLLARDDGDMLEDGAIGADALRGCVIAMLETEMRGACR